MPDQYKLELLKAIRSEDILYVEKLLKQGIFPQIGSWWQLPKNSPLCTAVRSSTTRIVELLLAYGAPIHEHRRFDYNALQIACHNRHIDMVRLLLDHGASPTIYPQQPSPLALAAYLGKTDIVTLLLEHGADPHDIWVAPDSLSLRLAKRIKRKLVARSGDAIDEVTHQTPHEQLMSAVYRGEAVELERLLKRGIPPERGRWWERSDESPLCAAVYANAAQIAELLIRYGAPVHEVGNFGENALQLACRKRNIAMVRLLLDYGASPAVYPNPPSPLEQAAYKGEDELVALLLHHGGEPQEVWERGAIFRIPAPVLRLLVASSDDPPEDAISILNAEGWEQ